MKRIVLPLTLSLALCAPLFGAEIDPRLDKAVRASLPVCGDVQLTYGALPYKLPSGFTGALVKMESARHSCDGQVIAAISPAGGFFLGSPWPIADEEGATIEDKLRSFTLRNLRDSMSVTIDRIATPDGLWPVTLLQTVEAGKMPLQGFVDQQGKIFFFGSFRRIKDDLPAQREKTFATLMAKSPSKGAANGAVTIVEFSDFQCPSCRRSMEYADTILARHGEKVRYVRFDTPLSGHPWAFPAALAGRAIHRQKPDLFWEYKKTVYDNQDKMTAFTFWDWARAWAEDHDLDLQRYDADLNDADLKAEILKGVGTAFSNDVRATPTYMVNGTIVDAGDDGKPLFEYVDKLVK